MPSQFESDIAEAYCCSHNLFRPDTNIIKALRYFAYTEGLIIIVVPLLYSILTRFNIISHFSLVVLNFQKEYPWFFFLVLYLFINILVFVLGLRIILIGVIRLYQHYAPDDIRRRCLFKPTCSEYTIMVLRKYGVLIGLYLAYLRLFKKCRGNIYRIDYPY